MCGVAAVICIPQGLNVSSHWQRLYITCWKKADALHGKYESLSFNSRWTGSFIYLKLNDCFTLFLPHLCMTTNLKMLKFQAHVYIKVF
jgi:hypothetical protein